METAVVIPMGPNRQENLQRALEHLESQNVKPAITVICCDGPESNVDPASVQNYTIPVVILNLPKHEPGMVQPRNEGAHFLMRMNDGEEEQFESIPEITHIWFLDSDIVTRPDALEHFVKAMEANDEPRILVGPYDWMPPGQVTPMPDLRNDPRWVSFNEYYPWDVERENLAAGLACFSGNLVWPLDLFKKVGGFWDELHHARCEDGELGLRAVGMGIGVSFVAEARGWHIHHDYSVDVVNEKNARDVPMINARHPWKELGQGGDELFVVDEDGKRFNVRCAGCGENFNSNHIWKHREECEGA
jgi:GT2 family glycosyltransferase